MKQLWQFTDDAEQLGPGVQHAAASPVPSPPLQISPRAQVNTWSESGYGRAPHTVLHRTGEVPEEEPDAAPEEPTPEDEPNPPPEEEPETTVPEEEPETTDDEPPEEAPEPTGAASRPVLSPHATKARTEKTSSRGEPSIVTQWTLRRGRAIHQGK